MQQAPIDELLKRVPSIYKLVVVASRRAKEMAEGSPKLVPTNLHKVASIALEEIHAGKVFYKPSDAEKEAGRKAKASRKSDGKASKKKD